MTGAGINALATSRSRPRLLKQRPDIRAAVAANLTGEPRLKIRQSGMIRAPQ